MNVSLPPDMQEFIDAELRAGRYATAEDVLRAGLASLEQEEWFGDFVPGELDALIAEGEQSIHREGTIAAEDVFGEIRKRSAARRVDAT